MNENNLSFITKFAICLLVSGAALLYSSAQAAEIRINDTAVACFTPEEDCTGLIAGAINSARSEVLVQAFSFTSRPISEALINARKRGARVEIILDSSFKWGGKRTAVGLAADAGIPIFVDSFHKKAHNKTIIIDAQTVITGSFNFTRAAQYDNAENVLILKSAGLARLYKENFRAHKKHSNRYVGSY